MATNIEIQIASIENEDLKRSLTQMRDRLSSEEILSYVYGQLEENKVLSGGDKEVLNRIINLLSSEEREAA